MNPLADECTDHEIVERVEYNNGIWVYLKGHAIPMKGMPDANAVFASNIAKKLLRTPYWNLIRYVMKPYILPKGQQTDFTRNLTTILQIFSAKNAESIAHIFEYDQAYRFRVQDLANEYDPTNPPHKEIYRLFNIWRERDRNEARNGLISKKFTWTIILASLLLLIPKYKKAFTMLYLLKPDSNDIYWMSLKKDYAYAGRSL